MLTTKDIPGIPARLLTDLGRKAQNLALESYRLLLQFDVIPPQDLIDFVDETFQMISDSCPFDNIEIPALTVAEELIENIESYLGDHDFQEPTEWPGSNYHFYFINPSLVDPISIYFAVALCRAIAAGQLLSGDAELPEHYTNPALRLPAQRFIQSSVAADEASELLLLGLRKLLEREGVFKRIRSIKQGELNRIESGRNHGQKMHRDTCRQHHEIIKELIYAYEDKVGDNLQTELSNKFCSSLASEVYSTLSGHLPAEALNCLNVPFVKKHLRFFQSYPDLFKAFIEAFSSQEST